jgi:5-formyltetrahydrofolate cyclo-ligase
MSDAESRRIQRREMRERRRSLTRREREVAGRSAAARLRALGLPRRGGRVAIYAAFDGELGTAAVAREARRRGCRVFLPVITDLRRRRMRFVEWRDGVPLVRQRNGIAAPAIAGATLPPRWLDLVLVPLVAFDAHGHRLGTGGGFYDRHFAFRRLRSGWRRPLLVGWAHDFQRVDSIASARWDVPLDLIVTDARVYRR